MALVFRVDSTWPKPLPKPLDLGAVVASRWMGATRVGSHTGRPRCGQTNAIDLRAGAAGPRFDRDGTLISSWGGPGPGYEWPQLEHGI